MKAIWNRTVIAESSATEVVESNHYFPPDSIKKEYFQSSDQTSNCPWKGLASYYDIVVDGKTNDGAAWYYPSPQPDAANIKDHVAFWKGIEVSE